MTTSKQNRINETANYGQKTIKDIMAVLGKHVDLSKLTDKQIGQLINAMYENYQNGYNACGKEFGNW